MSQKAVKYVEYKPNPVYGDTHNCVTETFDLFQEYAEKSTSLKQFDDSVSEWFEEVNEEYMKKNANQNLFAKGLAKDALNLSKQAQNPKGLEKLLGEHRDKEWKEYVDRSVEGNRYDFYAKLIVVGGMATLVIGGLGLLSYLGIN